MGKITTGIMERCRYRNEKTESGVKQLVAALPLLSPDKQDDYDMVYDWFLALRDDIYCNPAITSKKDFYMGRIFELGDSVLYGRTPEMERDTAGIFERYAKQHLDKNPAAENYDTYPEMSTGSVISFFDVAGGYNYLLGKDAEESIPEVFGLLEKSGYVTTEDMKTQLRKDIKELLKDFDSSTFLAEMKTVCSGDERITALLTQNEKLLGTLICSAMSEYMLLKIIFHTKISGNDRIIKNRKTSYLNQFLKRICYTAWRELIRLYFNCSETEISADINGTTTHLNMEELIKSCLDIMDDRGFLENLQNDFSFWTKITELLMNPEYYRTALSNFSQPTKKKQREDILKACKENGTVPDNEVIKSLICAAVNKMACLSPYDLKEYKRSEIYGPFDTTILQKNGGWFMGDIQTLPQSGSVYRDHVFTIAFALRLTVDDAESLLMDGAKLEGFDSKCILEAIYQYALNWKLSYADARKMWLKCIEMMILYNDDAAGFCSDDEVVQDEKYTEEISESINELYYDRDEKTDDAFLNMLAGCSKLLSIEELSEWIEWKYMDMEACGFDDETKEKLVRWIGQSNYDEILNKLDEMKNTFKTVVHKRIIFDTTRVFIQSVLEQTFRNNMRVMRVEYASALYKKLTDAWVEIVDSIQSSDDIENKYLYSIIDSIEESGVKGNIAREKRESVNNALSELIEGKYPVTIEALGNPLTADALSAHENGRIPVTRTDILRYSFWISLLSKDNYGEYDPETAFSRFRDIANRALAECRFHRFYVRSALDRVLYMCFWDKNGPMEAYQRIIGRLHVPGGDLAQKQVDVWKESIENSYDEELKKAISKKGETYMKALVWLSHRGVFDGTQPIWPQLAAFHLAVHKDNSDNIKKQYEKDKSIKIQKIEESIQACESKITDLKTECTAKKEMTQQRMNETDDPSKLTQLEMQMQSHRETYEKKTESISIKLEQLESEKKIWLSDEILRTKIEEEQEKCRNYTDDFINGCKEYFRRFSEFFPEWFIEMKQTYPSDRIEAMKKELETTD